MNAEAATRSAEFDLAELRTALARRIAVRTESQDPARQPELRRYLVDELAPTLAAMGFATQLWENPVAGGPPFLFAERIEDPALVTVLMYGHGDVVLGYDEQWKKAASPWVLEEKDHRWYGRGSADNKGQHSINLAALAHVLKTRGALGCNVKWLFEMGEEVGSPGLHATCTQRKAELAADVFIASDGPRLRSDQPTLFLGSRGCINFTLTCDLRDGAHHSGNWGGLLANPGTLLANAIASLVDARGRILVDALRPPPIPDSVRRALATIVPGEPERARDRRRLGRARAHAGRARVRLQRARSARVQDRQSREPGQRDSRARDGHAATALRGRLRSRRVHPGDARAPRRARLRAGRGGARRAPK